MLYGRSSIKLLISAILFCAVSFLCGCENHIVNSPAKPQNAIVKPAQKDKLAVLWTSGDPDVAHKVCFMYTHNAKKQGWFNTVELIVWGPSSKLLAEDQKIQNAVKAMSADGVTLKACKACADSYGVSKDLKALGIDVKYMGAPLTKKLKSPDWQVITF